MIQRRPITPEKALVAAEKLCVKAEHSSGEIRLNLKRKGLSETDIEAIIASLVNRRFIDDHRFAEAYVRDKAYFAYWGVNKIALMLRQKGVSRDIIDEALQSIDRERYTENLRRLIERKRSGLSAELSSYEANTRLFRAAASRGYEPDLIAGLLRAPH